MRRIFVLGSINMDFVFNVKRMPVQGETLKSEHFMMVPGGKGANQAVVCARQEINTVMLGSLGDDALSQSLHTSLVKAGVNVNYISTLKDQTCGVASIMIEDGDNRIIVDGGANNHHDIDVLKNIISEQSNPGDYLLVQNEIPLPVIETCLFHAKSLGLKTFFNVAPASKLPDKIYHAIDTIILNEQECKLLSGIDPRDKSSIHRAGEILMEKGVKSVLLTLGKSGSVYIDSTRFIMQPAYMVSVKDTTAAGDAFIGVVVSTLLEGSSIETALNRGSVSGALAVMKIGAQPSLPTKKAIDHFIANNIKPNRKWDNND